MVTDSPVPSWRVAWSTDCGESWEELGFETFEGAHGWAAKLWDEEGNKAEFSLYVERMMTVNLKSFLGAKSAGAVELAPHMLGTAKTFA
jgi:hypothetical protein